MNEDLFLTMPSDKPVTEEKKEPAESEVSEQDCGKQLELLLTERASKINEGNNGIIYKVEIGLDTELAHLLHLEGEGESVEKVIKLLKVYHNGQGKEEFEMQKRVYALCEEARSKGEKVARVPEAISMSDLNLSEDAKELLKSEGYEFASGHADIILMDYVEGVDLATYLFQEVVKRHSKLEHLRGEAETMSINDLQIEVPLALGYSKPGGKSHREGERHFEAEKVANENAELLVRFLEKSGFVLDPRIIEQAKGAFDAMHKGGLYHRDAHPRNVMIDPSTLGTESDPDVFLIDFGTAKEASPAEDKDEIYNDGEKRYVPDSYIANLLGRLTKTQEEKDREVILNKLNQARRLKPRLEKRKEWKEFWVDMSQNNLSVPEIFERTKKWPGGASPETQVKIFTLILLELSDAGKLDGAEIQSFVEEKLTGSVPPFLHNQLVDISRAFKL